jgi:hypothetical protein
MAPGLFLWTLRGVETELGPVLLGMDLSHEKKRHPLGEPLHGLANFAHLVEATSVGIVFGALLGVALADWLRRAERAWTWAILGVPGVALAVISASAGIVTGPAAAAIIGLSLGGTGGCMVFGAWRRIEERRAGADREAAARERIGVLDAFRRRIRQRPALRTKIRAEGIPMGQTRRGEHVVVRRGTAQSGSHVLIPGASGAGKTTSLAALLCEYVCESRFGAVVLEAKSDATLLAVAQAAAAATGARFLIVSPEGPCVYDPLAHGSVDELCERLIAVEDWGSADALFYRQAAMPFLRLVVRALHCARTPITLRRVADLCEADGLDSLAATLPDRELCAEISALTAGMRADERRAVHGLRARLQNLKGSDYARRWVDPERGGGPRVDLRRSIERREVVYFRFDTDRTGNVGKAIAQMALLDLGAAASAGMGQGRGTFVAIDEFGALEASALDRLFARGRAAGFSVAVGTQTLEDLRAAGSAVRERVGGSIESLVCHRIGTQDDAEWLAKLIGTVPSWETTVRTDRLGFPTDQGTRTRGHRFEVHPSELQRLRRGEAQVVALDRADGRRARRVSIAPPWHRLPQLARTDGGETQRQRARQGSKGEPDEQRHPHRAADQGPGAEGLGG